MKKITLNEDTVRNIVKNILMEMMDDNGNEYPDYIKPSTEFDPENDEDGYDGEETDIEGQIYDILNYCGWAYSNTVERPEGVTYVCHEDSSSNDPVSWDEVKRALTDVFGDRVGFGTAQHRYAPEIQYKTFTIKNDKLNESSDTDFYPDEDTSDENMLKSAIDWLSDRIYYGPTNLRGVDLKPEFKRYYSALRELRNNEYLDDPMKLKAIDDAVTFFREETGHLSWVRSILKILKKKKAKAPQSTGSKIGYNPYSEGNDEFKNLEEGKNKRKNHK